MVAALQRRQQSGEGFQVGDVQRLNPIQRFAMAPGVRQPAVEFGDHRADAVFIALGQRSRGVVQHPCRGGGPPQAQHQPGGIAAKDRVVGASGDGTIQDVDCASGFVGVGEGGRECDGRPSAGIAVSLEPVLQNPQGFFGPPQASGGGDVGLRHRFVTLGGHRRQTCQFQRPLPIAVVPPSPRFDQQTAGVVGGVSQHPSDQPTTFRPVRVVFQKVHQLSVRRRPGAAAANLIAKDLDGVGRTAQEPQQGNVLGQHGGVVRVSLPQRLDHRQLCDGVAVVGRHRVDRPQGPVVLRCDRSHRLDRGGGGLPVVTFERRVDPVRPVPKVRVRKLDGIQFGRPIDRHDDQTPRTERLELAQDAVGVIVRLVLRRGFVPAGPLDESLPDVPGSRVLDQQHAAVRIVAADDLDVSDVRTHQRQGERQTAVDQGVGGVRGHRKLANRQSVLFGPPPGPYRRRPVVTDLADDRVMVGGDVEVSTQHRQRGRCTGDVVLADERHRQLHPPSVATVGVEVSG